MSKVHLVWRKTIDTNNNYWGEHINKTFITVFEPDEAKAMCRHAMLVAAFYKEWPDEECPFEDPDDPEEYPDYRYDIVCVVTGDDVQIMY